MKFLFSTLLFIVVFCINLSAQVNFTANDQVVPYTGRFRTGINLGYYPGWSTQQLANIAIGNPAVAQKGMGAKSIRTGASESVLDFYGYNLLQPHMQHYASLGASEHVMVVGGPTGAHQSYSQHCPGEFSAMFANLYLPIWDGGANGTPYNDDNYYAAYMYKLVTTYKDDVRFWEIWNEPGLDYANLGWRGPDYPGNWWAEGPDPCDYILKAPIYEYIRTLRISWEIIKTVDPDGYVCLGSVGYQSLLNAILNNTDNPSMGDVSATYPLKGGAYFDCISFHSYPHFDGSTTNSSINLWQRHSDQAADGLTIYRNYYQTILDQYGYNGTSYPNKQWIVTEINSPRIAFGNASNSQPQQGKFFGGYDAQINHMMKAQMVAKVNKIHQLHTYNLFDKETDADATFEFDLMGMYDKLGTNTPYNITANDEAKAIKTTSDFIFDTEYDAARTAAMNLSGGVRGYAFKRPDGSYVYAIWARTTIDKSEAASATYSFPASFNLGNVTKHNWDYSYTGTNSTIPSTGIALDARPIFITAGSVTPPTCNMTATVSNILCNNNGTTSNTADDTYTYTLLVTVPNNTGNWSATIGGQAVSGTLGTAKTMGPYTISSGAQNYTVSLTNAPTCNKNVMVTPPASCSGGTPGTCNSASANPYQEHIKNIKIGSIDNASGKTFYSNFTNLSTNLAAGSTNPIVLTTGFSYTTYNEYWTIYIDFNKNNVYEASEKVFQGIAPAPPNGTKTSPYSANLSIPASATTGATKMRISMRRGAYADPCANFEFGEVEDYGVNITGGSGGGGTTPTYCASTSAFPWEDWISNVTVGNMTKASSKATYSNFTSSVANLIVGTAAPVSLTASFSYFGYSEYFKIWIDYNRNGIFEEPSEVAYQAVMSNPPNGTPSKIITGSLTVPVGTTAGTTRMRVSMKRGAYATPCETLPNGEVEDYTVSIANAVSSSQSIGLSADNAYFIEASLFGSGVQLNFAQLTPQAFVSFSVERMDEQGNYNKIYGGNAGDALRGVTYAHYDSEPNPGNNTYRIAWHDAQDNITYTEAKQIFVRRSDTFKVFPNPAAEEAIVDLGQFMGKEVQLIMYNATGIETNAWKYNKVETPFVTINLEQYPSGTYYFQLISTGSRAETQKLIVEKI